MSDKLPMTAKGAREVAMCVDEWASPGFKGLSREIATTLMAYADMLDEIDPAPSPSYDDTQYNRRPRQTWDGFAKRSPDA